MTRARKFSMGQALVSTALAAKCFYDGEILVGVFLALIAAVSVVQFHVMADYIILDDKDVANRGGDKGGG